jgi:hypothetical protein
MLFWLTPASSARSATGWQHPFLIVKPANRDVWPTQIAFSPRNASAMAFGAGDADVVGSGSAFLAARSGPNAFSPPRRIPRAQQALALAFDGTQLELLVGDSRAGFDCCGWVQAVQATAHGFIRRHTLIAKLTGATVAQLVTTASRLLAVVATERGVWAAQTGAGGHFGPTRKLSPNGTLPEAVATTVLSGGHSVVVWTAKTGLFATGPRTILRAGGSAGMAPRGHRTVITVPIGHAIEELAVAAHGSVPTVAWIESWFDGAGQFHSQAYAADLTARPAARRLSPPGELASGLVAASSPAGAQVIAFRACNVAGTCELRALARGMSNSLSAAGRISSVDGDERPAVAESSAGQALVGWIDQGHVRAVSAAPDARHFGATQTISDTAFGADLTLAFAPSGAEALAVWTQGTLAESVLGAVYRAR